MLWPFSRECVVIYLATQKVGEQRENSWEGLTQPHESSLGKSPQLLLCFLGRKRCDVKPCANIKYCAVNNNQKKIESWLRANTDVCDMFPLNGAQQFFCFCSENFFQLIHSCWKFMKRNVSSDLHARQKTLNFPSSFYYAKVICLLTANIFVFKNVPWVKSRNFF